MPDNLSLVPAPVLESEESIPSQDLQTFSLIQRWKDGENLSDLADEIKMSREGLRKRIKSLAYRYSGVNRSYQDLVEEVILGRMIQYEEELETAGEKRDGVALACARELLKHSQWLAERRLPKKFAPKQSLEVDKQVTVIVQRGRDIPKLLNDKDMDAVSQSQE